MIDIRRATVFLLALGVGGQAIAQGFPAADAAKQMATPRGFRVELVAAEPTIRQPVAIDFDERGRLWVLQYLQYPNPAGLKRVKVDRYSRTVYDRVPDPPPNGPQGADRLTILEPLAGQPGKFRAKDFVAGLNLASGFAFGHDGVFVLQTPYLLFYPDRNRDDEPDGDPEVLLSGFGMEDAHSVANSLTWGPDGWLYGCQGSTVTAKIRNPAKPDDPPIEFQQGVWRYHPLSRRFELFCEGGGNSWGLDFDRDGHLLYSTNHGGHVLLHGVQGGYYWKAFGKHGNLHNPYAYGYFDHAPHQNFRGGHVTVGGLVYQGDAYPTEFRGKYIAADLLGHAVYWHDILPDGSTIRTRHGGELLLANDTWFAPSDLAFGPDGFIYVADWHDKRTAHPDPDAEWDRSNGRIYRILHASATPRAVGDLGKLTSSELVKLLDHPNAWHARTARRLLAARRDPEMILPLRTRVLEAKDPQIALNALWALYVCGGLNESYGVKLLDHSAPMVRYWAVRLLGDEERISDDTALQLTMLATMEQHSTVCSQLACTARRLSSSGAAPILRELIKRAGVERDRYLPLLCWWGIEERLKSDLNHWEEWLTRPETQSLPIATSFLIPRILRRWLASGTNSGWDAALRLWKTLHPAERKIAMLPAIEAALQDLPPTVEVNRARADWIRALKADIDSKDQRTTEFARLRILVRMNDAFAVRNAREAVQNRNISSQLRIGLIMALSNSDTESLSQLTSLINSRESPAVQLAALSAIPRSDDSSVAQHLLSEYLKLPADVRARIRSVMYTRPAWARALLVAIDAGDIPKDEITIDELRPLAASADDKIKALVRKHWGALPVTTPDEKLAEVRRLNNDLRAGTGDAKNGRLLFRQHCAACHKLFDEGTNIGPDLTHANRFDRDYLLVSTVDPSAVIRREYLTHVIQTKDGRSLTGLIVEQTPNTVTLFTPAKDRVTVPQAQIEEMIPSDRSLMPENLLKLLKSQELRDLFAFLHARTPPPK